MEIKGNKFLFTVGTILANIGNRLIKKHKVKTIVNAQTFLLNPFTILTTFKIDGDSYQLITEGDYKHIYKTNKDEPMSLTDSETLAIITANKKGWFLKK